MSRSPEARIGVSLLLATILVGGATPLAADEAGWQVGLTFGRSTLEERFGDPEVRPKSFDDRADASAVEVAYFFTRYLGLEAGYHDLGTFRGTGASCPADPIVCRESLALYAPAVAEAEITGWSLAVVPSWPFTRRLTAYGKLGVMARDTEVFTNVQRLDGGRDLDRLSGTDLLTGVGLRYRVGRDLGTLVEYQHAELDTTALGLTWSF